MTDHNDRCTCGHAAHHHALVVSGQSCLNVDSGKSTSGIIGVPYSHPCRCIQFVKDGGATDTARQMPSQLGSRLEDFKRSLRKHAGGSQ